MKKTLALAILLSLLVGCSTVPHQTEPAITKQFLTKSPRPTVIVAHGCDGVDNVNYTNWAQEIHSWGYNTVVADSFKIRHLTSGVCKDPVSVLPDARARDLITLAAYIKTQPWHEGKIAVIGFSHGGSTVLKISNTKQDFIDATVAYYPSCLKRFIGINTYDPYIPTQVHLAGRDDWTPASECDYLPIKDKYLYPDATHAFDMHYPDHVYLGHHMAYNKKADMLAMQRTKEFLSTTLK
jgi:dienelactone hydrolase